MKKFVSVSSAAASKLQAATQPKSTSKFASVTSIKALGDPPRMSKKGAKGEHVEKLQRALQLKKVYSGIVDGSFGKMTQEAVIAYQRPIS